MDETSSPEIRETKPARTKLDRVFRVEIWMLAGFLVVGGIAAGFGLGKTLQVVGFGGAGAMLMVILATPVIALPFVARRRDPPLAEGLAWLVRFSGLCVATVGAALLLASEHLPLLGWLTGIPLAAIGAWAIAHTWTRSAAAGQPLTVHRDAALAVGLAAFVLTMVASGDMSHRSHVTRFDRLNMRADLRQLVEFQQTYFDSTRRFADSVALRHAGFRTSPSIHLQVDANDTSWRAMASFDQSVMTCFTWVGVRPEDSRFSAPEQESSCREPGKPEKPWIAIEYPVESFDSISTDAFVLLLSYGNASPVFEGTATAEGLVNGERKRIPLRVTPTSRGGVYAVPRQWPADGRWLLVFGTTPAGAEHGDYTVVQMRRGAVFSMRRFDRDAAVRKEVEKRLRESVASR